MEQTDNVPSGEVCLTDLEKEQLSISKNSKNPQSYKTKEGLTTLFHQVKEDVEELYDLRFDNIKLDFEISLKNKNQFSILNDSNLYVELREKSIKISKSDLREILKSDFVQKINPINHYFGALGTYDEHEPDYIEQLAGYVKVENQAEFKKNFKKHLVRTVRCGLDDSYFNKQAFVLVQSGQNTGKTTFLRFLCPPALKDYFAEDIKTDKDGLILLAKNLIINLDELSSLHKSEINTLKSYFSKSLINVRLPYASKNSNIARKCSFFGSTNLAQFLTDETGSVRWVCFSIQSIDWNYSNNIDINNVWRQAYHLYKTGFKHELSVEEIKENELRNAQFQLISFEEELISKYLEIPNDDNIHLQEFLQASEITTYLQQCSGINKINSIQIGKILGKYFKRDKKMKGGMQRYGYFIVKS
ncbi:MAG: virulence-associated E family protein [Arcicella sp.]|nr:virulence-associated E family protein [Arcicella sp.]